MSLTYAQLEQVWLQAAQGTKYDTQSWAALMAAIAEAESRGNPTAENQTDNGGTQTSWGLWQISLGNHNEPSPNWADPVTNAKLAIGKLNTQGLGAWGTYQSGAYKAFLQGNVPPGTGSIPGGGSSGGGGGSGGGTATLTSAGGNIFNSFANGFLGNLIGLPPVAQADPLQALVAMANDIAQFFKWISWLFNPSHWLRVGAFVVGVFAFAGAGYMIKEAL